MYHTRYLDFKKSILAMFCSTVGKPFSVFPKVEKQSTGTQSRVPPIWYFPSRPPVLWNFIGLQPLSALLRDLADTSACFS